MCDASHQVFSMIRVNNPSPRITAAKAPGA
jgi:hypothetical protein